MLILFFRHCCTMPYARTVGPSASGSGRPNLSFATKRATATFSSKTASNRPGQARLPTAPYTASTSWAIWGARQPQLEAACSSCLRENPLSNSTTAKLRRRAPVSGCLTYRPPPNGMKAKLWCVRPAVPLPTSPVKPASARAPMPLPNLAAPALVAPAAPAAPLLSVDAAVNGMNRSGINSFGLLRKSNHVSIDERTSAYLGEHQATM